ncbi:MAG: hypothetical protein DRK00_10015 [Thermoprotei archaeon]|nr:MAG: hypothetical protein DRK00_10015 [Thermoprotei archaeon]
MDSSFLDLPFAELKLFKRVRNLVERKVGTIYNIRVTSDISIRAKWMRSWSISLDAMSGSCHEDCELEEPD